MAIKLFKRKAKKANKDKTAAQEESHQDTTKSADAHVGHSASTSEESNESIDHAIKEGLYPRSSIKERGGKNKGNTPELQIISARDGADKFRVSEVRDSTLHESKGFKAKRTTTVPSAKQSAYTGPPRYDWIDVETAAAIKVQSVFRRHKVLRQLEAEGKSTAAMRNKIRSRNATNKSLNSEDVPNIFRFCGIGFLFSDATGEDTNAINEGKAAKRDEQFDAKINKDKKLRAFKMRQKPAVEYEEAVEVVDY